MPNLWTTHDLRIDIGGTERPFFLTNQDTGNSSWRYNNPGWGSYLLDVRHQVEKARPGNGNIEYLRHQFDFKKDVSPTESLPSGQFVQIYTVVRLPKSMADTTSVKTELSGVATWLADTGLGGKLIDGYVI